MTLTGNKGDWSEIYVLIKLLSELKLFSADENLNKTTSYLDVLSILRNDTKEYNYTSSDEGKINVIDVNKGDTLFSITRQELSLLSENIFHEIKNSTGLSFSIRSDLHEQLDKLLISRVKQKSNQKGDINILLHDPAFGISTQRKYSIKSFIGSPPTLFNANKTTNIIYEILNEDGKILSTDEIDEINEIGNPKKYIKRIKSILEKKFKIIFYKFEDNIFKLNLEIIDSRLPEIISFIVLEKYVNSISNIISVIQNLNIKNPLNYDLTKGHQFYEYRIINFLVEASLGMTSSVVWNGLHDATGGIIIAKNNSEVLCYHLMEFNKFKAYLKKSTKLDNPSGTKMGYGKIYKEGNKFLIKLNFQIKA